MTEFGLNQLADYRSDASGYFRCVQFSLLERRVIFICLRHWLFFYIASFVILFVVRH